MNPLYETLRGRYPGRPSRAGFIASDCPFCAAPLRKNRQAAFSKAAFCCKACGITCSLAAFGEQLGITVTDGPRPARIAQEPRKPAHWQTDPNHYLERLCGDLSRLQLWQAYKPLSLESISRWRLGVGRVPATDWQHKRLVAPVFAGGKCVGFRGRAYLAADDGPKWLTAGGMAPALFNADLITPGATIIICENMIDSILAMQETPGVVAVASTHGVHTWLAEWTALIARTKPDHVVVWCDNDLAGQPNAETYKAEMAAWRHKMQTRLAEGKIATMPAPPQPAGPKIANELTRAHVPVTLYQWPAGTPAKQDLGAALMHGRSAA